MHALCHTIKLAYKFTHDWILLSIESETEYTHGGITRLLQRLSALSLSQQVLRGKLFLVV